MTPQENVDLLTSQIVDGLHAIGVPLPEIAYHCEMSPKSLKTFCERMLKTGGSINNFAALADYLGYELQLVKQPPSPASRGVSPCENDSNHVSN